jgi:RHS repeat-associated protein
LPGGILPLRYKQKNDGVMRMNRHVKFAQARCVVAAIPTLLLFFIASTSPVHAAVGRTPGQYAVGLSGDAQYVVPLWTPPGTNGLGPALSLAYSSHAGNGWIGRGFAIPAFSSISRCNSTVAQDASAAGLLYASADRYCLDGQRLRLVSGTYAFAGSTYQTELESFRKITIMAVETRGPQWFEVRTREGLILEYGRTADSRIRLLDATSGFAQATVVWTLNRMSDRAGNFVDFTYTQDSLNGGYYPQEIRWTGNTNGTPAVYRAVFVNEVADRPDTIRNQFFGVPPGMAGKFNFTKRLGRVEVYYIPTNQLLRKYQLTYEAAGGTGGLSRLQSLQECGIGGTDCLTPTQLTWNTPTWSTTQSNTGVTGATPLLGDITGDGRDDLVWPAGNWLYKIADSAGGFGPSRDSGISAAGHTESTLIRWDRDSRDDLIVAVNGAWSVLRANGNGFDAIVNTGFTASSPVGFADINGDGLSDIVRKGGAGFLVRHGSGTGLGFGAEVLAMTATWNPVSISAKRKRDFDGDGREDLVVVYDQVDPLGNHTFHTHTLFGTGNTLTPWNDFGIVSTAGTGDFDGDSKTDFAWISGGILRTTIVPGSGPAATPGTVTIADWNGDGRDDAIIGNTVAVSTATGFAAPVPTGFSPTVARVGDVDGDTFPDLLGMENGEVKVLRHSTSMPWYTRDRLQECTDGFGVKASFAYGALNDASTHTPSVGATAPMIDLGDASVVLVKTMTSTDGTGSGATFTLSFGYEGAKTDSTGRGFLGFAKRTVVDPRLGFNVRTEHLMHQNWPLVGLIREATIKQASGAPISETKNTWKSLTYDAGQPDRTRNFPYVSSSTTKDFEAGGIFDGTHYRTVTATLPGTDGVNGIDAASGLVVDVTTTTTEIATGVSTGQTHSQRIYQPGPMNDTASWCMGRPTQVQSINSHSFPGGTAQTRTLSMIWDGPTCRLTQNVVEPGNAQWQVTSDYGYDGFGNINSITVTPAAGQGQAARLTTVDWGATGRFPRSMRNPKLQLTQFGWDDIKAVMTSTTDPNSLAVNWLYNDNFLRLTRATRADGTATDFSLTACTTTACQESIPSIRTYALAIERDTANGEIRRSYRYFDLFDREVSSKERVLSGADSLVRRSFDARGSLDRQSMPYFASEGINDTTFSYDVLARPTLIRRATSEVDSSHHDTGFMYQGLTTIMTDALGRTTTRKSNAAGLIAQMLDAANNDTDYEYDAFGNLLTIRDVSGREIDFTYNVRGMTMSASDPRTGSREFTYYPLGQLRRQTNAKGQPVNFEYDVLSRPMKRSEPEGDTLFFWDTAAGKGIGQLEHVESPGGYRETYTYDNQGRRTQTSIVADGSTYLVNQSYSATTGLLETLTYPTTTAAARFKLRYGYQNGVLQTVSDFTGDVPGTVYWQANATNARGQVVDEQFGNTLRTISGYDRISGLLDDRTTGPGGGSARQNLAYEWNKAGSLTLRRDLNLSLMESFQYDTLDRLDFSQLNGATNLDMGYDAIGNVNSNSNTDVGNDASITWSSFNLPTAINRDGGSYSQFQYGADRSRYKHVTDTPTTDVETTINIRDLYERVTRGSVVEHRHYIFVPGGAAAVYNRKSSGDETSYLLKDHLGSVDMITSSTGSQLVRLSYDAFGRRRNGGTWSGNPAASAWTTINNTTHRGFTGHEHLDNVGLIHMNGRVLDPGMAGFTAADPIVQAPFWSQSLNRYSYVFNDPLSWTDPSGYCGATSVTFLDGGVNSPNQLNGAPNSPDSLPRSDYNLGPNSNRVSSNVPCPLSEQQLYLTLSLLNTSRQVLATGQAGRGIGTLQDHVAIANGFYVINPNTFPLGVPDFATTSGICLGACHGTMPDGPLRPMTPTESLILDISATVATLPLGGQFLAALRAGRNSIFWVGPTGEMMAVASGGRFLRPTKAALEAAAKGDWTLMRAESAAFARAATGPVRVFYGDGKGRIFRHDELPELLKSLESGVVPVIEIIF